MSINRELSEIPLVVGRMIPVRGEWLVPLYSTTYIYDDRGNLRAQISIAWSAGRVKKSFLERTARFGFMLLWCVFWTMRKRTTVVTPFLVELPLWFHHTRRHLLFPSLLALASFVPFRTNSPQSSFSVSTVVAYPSSKQGVAFFGVLACRLVPFWYSLSCLWKTLT